MPTVPRFSIPEVATQAAPTVRQDPNLPLEAFGGGAEPYKPEPKYKPGFAEFLNSLLLERAE